MLPVSRKALLQHRYELHQMLDIVKEIEAMNRNDIATILDKIHFMSDSLVKAGLTDKKTKDDKDGLEYQ